MLRFLLVHGVAALAVLLLMLLAAALQSWLHTSRERSHREPLARSSLLAGRPTQAPARTPAQPDPLLPDRHPPQVAKALFVPEGSQPAGFASRF